MNFKQIAATLGTTATVIGGVDASVLNETPIALVAEVADERIEVRQEENTVATLLPWKDQPGLRVKYDLGEPTLTERFFDQRRKEIITEVVPFADSQGFKVDVLLYERPATNCFSYQLDGWEAFDFFLQPPLTEQEIAEGAVRPEEIIGSYAVYHKTLRDHIIGQENYGTGKFMHIPYPYVWELNNEESTRHRAESFTIEKGLLTVCVKPEFLDTATYPVRVDPTFGYTGVGGSNQLINDNTFAGNVKTLPDDDALIESVTLNGYSAFNFPTKNVRAVIVSTSTFEVVENGVANPVLYLNNTQAGQQWKTHTFPNKPILDSGDWVLGFIAPAVEISRFYYSWDSTSNTDVITETSGANNFSNPQTLTSPSVFASRTISIYATYSIAEPPPPPSNAPANATYMGTGGTVYGGGILIR